MTSVNSKPLDRIDITILDELQKDGRVSNVDLANKVNLSASPCLDRVKKLEKAGYIEGYRATLCASKLKYGMSAFIQVTLDRTNGAVFNLFKKDVVTIKEVAECHMVAGGFDYLLKIRFENMEAYRRILGEIVELTAVAHTHTFMIMEHIKNDEGVPLY